MKINKDYPITPDLIIGEGSKVSGKLPPIATSETKGLVKVELKKRYPVREGLVIETGTLYTGEYRALQLQKKGFVVPVISDESDVIKRHIKKANKTTKTN